MSEGIYTTPEPTDDTYETISVSDPQNTAQRGGIELNVYENLRGSGPGNTAQHGGFKKNFFKAVAACVGLLLLAGIIVLFILNLDLTKQRDQWKTSSDEFQTRHYNLTERTDHCDKLETRLNNLTELTDQCKTSLNTMTDQRDQLETSLKTMTDQRDQWKTRFDELLGVTDLTELKRIRCESHGFTLGGDGCYYISTEGKTWEDSRAFCTARQSDLMTIKSREKQDFVDGLVGGSKLVWIGLTDSETEGVWKWVDGTTLITPDWTSGEPNDYGGREDCVDVYNGGWNDAPCGGTTYWVCEIVF